MTEKKEKENDTTPAKGAQNLTRIRIYNVSENIPRKDLEKEINGWITAILGKKNDSNDSSGMDTKIVVTKMRKPENKDWTLLTLESESMVETFVNGINEGQLTTSSGCKIHAKIVSSDGKEIETSRKRKGEGEEGKGAKKQRVDGKPLSDDYARNKVTSYWKLNYEKQLEKKQQNMNSCVGKIIKQLEAIFRDRAEEYKKANVFPYYYLSKKSPINIAPIIPSPAVNAYCNKSVFHFGYHHSCPDPSSPETKIKTPAVGLIVRGRYGVAHPHSCSHIPNTACGIANVIGEFLKDCTLPIYDCTSRTGVWRMVTVRLSHRRKECMVIISHAPPGGETNGDDGKEMAKVWKAEKKRLVKMLTGKAIPCPERTSVSPVITTETEGDEMVPITSIFFQEYDGFNCPPHNHPVQHAFGKEYLEEQLGECKFRISPGSYFKANTAGAEVLYDAVVEKLREVSPKNPKRTLLFDIYCGSGILGLHCMKKGAVGRVVCVNGSEFDVRDAVANSEGNGYRTSPDDDDDSSDDETENTRLPTPYIASRTVSAFKSDLLKMASTTPIAAVVGSGRIKSGAGADVIKSIRAHKSISRLIYLCDNQQDVLWHSTKAAALLMAPTSKEYTGLPFRLTCAQPMDMLPSNFQVNIIMVFDRMSKKEYKNVLKLSVNKAKEDNEEKKMMNEDESKNDEDKKKNRDEEIADAVEKKDGQEQKSGSSKKKRKKMGGNKNDADAKSEVKEEEMSDVVESKRDEQTEISKKGMKETDSKNGPTTENGQQQKNGSSKKKRKKMGKNKYDADAKSKVKEEEMSDVVESKRDEQMEISIKGVKETDSKNVATIKEEFKDEKMADVVDGKENGKQQKNGPSKKNRKKMGKNKCAEAKSVEGTKVIDDQQQDGTCAEKMKVMDSITNSKKGNEKNEAEDVTEMSTDIVAQQQKNGSSKKKRKKNKHKKNVEVKSDVMGEEKNDNDKTAEKHLKVENNIENAKEMDKSDSVVEIKIKEESMKDVTDDNNDKHNKTNPGEKMKVNGKEKNEEQQKGSINTEAEEMIETSETSNGKEINGKNKVEDVLHVDEKSNKNKKASPSKKRKKKKSRKSTS